MGGSTDDPSEAAGRAASRRPPARTTPAKATRTAKATPAGNPKPAKRTAAAATGKTTATAKAPASANGRASKAPLGKAPGKPMLHERSGKYDHSDKVTVYERNLRLLQYDCCFDLQTKHVDPRGDTR